MAGLFSRSLIFKPYNSISSVGYVVSGSILISIGPFFVEFSSLDATSSSFYRMLIGGLFFLLITIFRKQRFPKKTILLLCFGAGLTLALDLITWNQSVLYIGSGLSTILANLEIIFLIIIGRLFFQERNSPVFFKMCSFIIVGVCLLIHPYFFKTSFCKTLGIFYAIGASLIYSIYLLLLKIIGEKDSEISSTSTLSIICLSGAFITGLLITSNPSSTFIIPNLRSFICVFSNGVLSQLFGWWSINKGIKDLKLSTSGLLLLIQPGLTFVFDYIFLKRNTHWLQIVGCLIILVTVYRTMQNEKKKEVAL